MPRQISGLDTTGVASNGVARDAYDHGASWAQSPVTPFGTKSKRTAPPPALAALSPAPSPPRPSTGHSASAHIKTIAAHGAPGAVELGPEGSGNVVSGNEFAQHVAREHDPNTKAYKFISCDSAWGGPFSNAQMLTNQTGAVVFGYKGKASRQGGEERRFTPQPPPVAAVTAKVNAFISKVTRW